MSRRTNAEEIAGEYRGGKLEGYFKAGILHGFARHFEKRGQLTFLGNHKNGKPDGTCWKIIRGGGCIVGRVDTAGKLTGEDIAYIYPDYATALVGQFRHGALEKAQEAVITDICEDKVGIKIPIFSKPGSHVHVRQDRNMDPVLFLDPTTRDPYESKMVVLHTSDIPGADEGLFAKVPMEMNTTVAFYNGDPVKAEDFDPDTWDTNSYKIFDPIIVPRGTIDIPPWAQVSKTKYFIIRIFFCCQSLAAYCATLAHKTNHSFQPNAQFTVFDHPKFGLIPCIATIVDIQQGEEVS